MKRFLSGGPKKGDQRRNPEPVADDAEEKDGGFPMTDGYLMIFGGTAAYDSKRCQKLARHEVYVAELATPSLTGPTTRRASRIRVDTRSWSTRLSA
jgi:small neutral amino acid transporter SnatA (MarC family)